MINSNVKYFIRKMLILFLHKLGRARKKAVRKDVSIFHREIHIPIWFVATVIYLLFFGVLILELMSNYELIIAVSLLLTLCTFFAIYFLKKYVPKLLHCDDSITLIGLILLVSTLLILVVKNHNLPPLITPLPAGTMLITILLGPLPAFIVAMINIFILTFLYSKNFALFFTVFFASLAAIVGTIQVYHRRDIAKAGLYVSFMNLISILFLAFMSKIFLPQKVFNDIIGGVFNGIISSMIAVGVLPFLESLFSITTNIRLLELADFTQPLLKRMMLEAPGTYHHSQLVGTMGEQAARLIGANPMLVRVGAYYHDIGKIEKSEYFIENQPLELISRHDELSPNLSSLILSAHVKDGVSLAKKYKLDKAIIDIIEQHHGTSLIQYFYHKAMKESKEEVNEEKYRYPGPKPNTKEAGIIMLADSAEAAVRSGDEFSHAKIQDIVGKIVNNKFVDGQLDECDITLKDLHIIADSFVKTLVGIYHNRVEYPEPIKNEDKNL
ncbi:MAG: HDIG domain-containing metalloprotein [Elusimicrobiota bacterium]